MSSKLHRIIEMDHIIRSNRYPNAQFFCARFDIKPRTVYEDVEYFRNTLCAPLAYSRSKGGYYYSDQSWRLADIIATEGELLAFFLGAELARRYLGTSFEAPLRNAISKLSANLPAQLQLDLGLLTQHYSFQSGATASADPTLLVALSEAMIQCYPIEMTYFTASRGERNERVIEPYHLHNVRGDWQVIAFDRLRQNVRNFAVSRIEQWRPLTNQRFQRTPGFSIGDYLSSGFLAERGDMAIAMEIWFDAYQAHYMRGREWHPTQSIEEHHDGSMTLRFQSGALDEIRRWVMSFGRHAQARSPELREVVLTELEAALQSYKSSQ